MLTSTPCRFSDLPAAHHVCECSRASLVDAIRIVQFCGAVDAQSDQEAVALEEHAPRVIQPRPIRLNRVGDLLIRPPVSFDVLDRALEEVQPHQRRFAALPADDHFRTRLRLEQLSYVGLEQVVEPSGNGCPGRAFLSTGKNNTCSRDCRQRPSASPEGGRQLCSSSASHDHDGQRDQAHPRHERRDDGGCRIRDGSEFVPERLHFSPDAESSTGPATRGRW